ncbi:MAG: polysaccharide biosynthesis C-terminal domain-containing protein [Bacteroidales bacterium]|nr:polysaccharide biosynthesis C-terminal domain-containing protein [Bacteroidales bacterium]
MNLSRLPFISYFIGMFSRGHERSIKAKKNIFFSTIIKGISIAISLILVPLTISYVNPTRYGIWLTLSSIIGWFGFFDIGFGNGMRNKFAEAVANDNHELARIYVSTTYGILSIIIGIVLIIFFCINPCLNWAKILNTPADMAGELSILALIVFSFFCIQFILQLITTILTANQEPAKASFFNLLGSVFSLLIIFVLTKTTKGNLIYLGIALGLSPVLVLTASSLWYFKHEYKKYAPSIKYVKFTYARDLMTLGLKFFIIQIASIVIYQTSNIIIAQLFGPTQVTPFNIAFKYFSVVSMGFGIVMIPFWSAFTEAWTKKDTIWIKNTIRKLTQLWVLISTITLIMLLFSNFVYKLWVGKEIIVPLGISIVMAFYVILNTWCGIFSHFLNGVGKIKLQLYSGAFGAIVNIPLSIFLGKKIGIHGVILSTTFLAAISAIWSPIQYLKLINNKATGIWNK